MLEDFLTRSNLRLADVNLGVISQSCHPSKKSQDRRLLSSDARCWKGFDIICSRAGGYLNGNILISDAGRLGYYA
jgi:hypothetical protein